MADKKLLSIIVPIYNVKPYLKKCISSIISQSYRNIEIILVDDGSTDGSGAICDSYAREDNRIKVIHKANGGLVSARKKGISVVEGRYIGFVDGDDFIDRKMYEKLVWFLEEQQVDFVHSGYIKEDGLLFSPQLKKKYLLNSMESRIRILENLVFNAIDKQALSPSIWSKLFKKELLTEIYMDISDELSYGEDLLCLCGCILKCDAFGSLPEAYYHYLKRDGSICNKRRTENIQRETKLYTALQKLFEKYGCYEETQNTLEHFYIRNMLICMKQLTNVACPVYQYPTMSELAGKKILLYGIGEVGQDYYTQFCRDMRCTIVAVSDKCKDKYFFNSLYVIGMDEIGNIEFDVIVIAVLYEITARTIREELESKGIEKEKILWRQPEYTI